MTRRFATLALVCACTFTVLAGCAQQQGMNMDPAAMKPPERCPEMDMLQPWVGNWDATGEMTGPDGKKMTSTGTMECNWDLDKRILVERSTFTMGEMGTMTGLGIYTYCPKGKTFKTSWFSSMGEAANGTMCYDSAKKCWCMSSRYINPMSGQPSEFSGHMTMPDNNTITWEMKEYSIGFLGAKTLNWEGKGTSRRKS